MSDQTLCLSARPEDWAYEIKDILSRVLDREPEASFDDSLENMNALADAFRWDVDNRLAALGVDVVWTHNQKVGTGALVQWSEEYATRAVFDGVMEREAAEWVDAFVEEVRRDA